MIRSFRMPPRIWPFLATVFLALLMAGTALAHNVTEGDAGQQQMIFVLSMPLAAPHPVVVNYITVDGTAVGAAPGATDLTGKDFRAITSGSVTIPAGQLTAQIPVTVFGDLVDEPIGEVDRVEIHQPDPLDPVDLLEFFE